MVGSPEHSLPHADNTPPYSTCEKLLLEGRLVFGSLANREVLEGAKDSVKDTFSWHGLAEVGTGLVVGSGIGRLLESKRGRGVGMTMSLLLVGSFVGSALWKVGSRAVDTWNHPDRFNEDQRELAKYYGKTLTDAGKSLAVGFGVGAAYGRYSTTFSRKIFESQYAQSTGAAKTDFLDSIPGLAQVEHFFAPGWVKRAAQADFSQARVSAGGGDETFDFSSFKLNKGLFGKNQNQLRRVTFHDDATVIDEVGGRKITIEKSGRKTIEEPEGGRKITVRPSTLYFSPTIFAQSEWGQRVKEAAQDLGYSQWFQRFIGHGSSWLRPGAPDQNRKKPPEQN